MTGDEMDRKRFLRLWELAEQARAIGACLDRVETGHKGNRPSPWLVQSAARIYVEVRELLPDPDCFRHLAIEDNVKAVGAKLKDRVDSRALLGCAEAAAAQFANLAFSAMRAPEIGFKPRREDA